MIRQILLKFSGVVLLLLPVFEIVYTKKPFGVNMDHLYKRKIFQERKFWYLLVKWGKQKVKGNCVFIIYFLDWKHFLIEFIGCCWQEITLSTLILTDWVFKYSCNVFFKMLATILFLLHCLSWTENVLQFEYLWNSFKIVLNIVCNFSSCCFKSLW